MPSPNSTKPGYMLSLLFAFPTAVLNAQVCMFSFTSTGLSWLSTYSNCPQRLVLCRYRVEHHVGKENEMSEMPMGQMGGFTGQVFPSASGQAS